jgi:hypothetical protein
MLKGQASNPCSQRTAQRTAGVPGSLSGRRVALHHPLLSPPLTPPSPCQTRCSATASDTQQQQRQQNGQESSSYTPGSGQAAADGARQQQLQQQQWQQLQELLKESIEVAIATGPRGLLRGLQAARAVASLVGEYAAAGRVDRPEVVLRKLFERLGVTFIKLGAWPQGVAPCIFVVGCCASLVAVPYCWQTKTKPNQRPQASSLRRPPPSSRPSTSRSFR